MRLLQSPSRSSLRQRLLLLAGGACLLHFTPACGSSSSGDDSGSPAGASNGVAGAPGNSAGAANTPGGSGSSAAGAHAGGGTGASGATSTSGGSTSSGGASSSGGANSAGGANSSGGKGGATGAGGAGKGGATSAGGSAGASTSGGATGAAGAGTLGSCTTPPNGSALVGWASQSGMGVTTTTGGGNATPTMVTSLAALQSAVAGTTAKVIYVTGKLANGKVSIGSNKTIVGLCGAEIHGHLGLSNASNVIIRNLKIVGYGVGNCALDPDYDSSVGCSSGNDAVTINDNSHHIWVDHCDISDGTDGNLDTTQGADFVTISWTKFHYTTRTDSSGNDSTGAEGHRFSNLIGAADNVAGDVGHLNITWHHDWWADNVVERMPRSRAGKIHMFNNLFTSVGDSYCSNAGQGASLVVENSVFNGVKAPFQVVAGAVGLKSTGNVFTNTSGSTTGSGSGFTPPYSYTPDATGSLQATIEASCGPQ